MMSTTEAELDVEVPLEREEGELEDSDVEDGTYIPLQRPEAFNPPSLVNMQIQDEPSDDDSPESSGSGSDDEPQRRAKRTKVCPKRLQPVPAQEKKNKYNVWCTALQEDLLTEDMGGCDVTKKKNSYGVESYDYTIKYRLEDNYDSKKVFSNNSKHMQDDQSNKRRHRDRCNVKLRLGKRVNSHQQNEERHEPRVLEDLRFSAEDAAEDIARDIAEKLSEEKQDLLLRIVTVLGASKTIELYKETQRIEADGGMLVMNGTRRRTPGGVYFFLLKRDDDVSQDMVNRMFTEDRKQTARKIKRARAKSRQRVVEQLKQSLTDSELPSLLSRGEATLASAAHAHGSNPPPSPATDARLSSDTSAPPSPPPPPPQHPPQQAAPRAGERPPQGCDDDDYLEVMCNDDMDMF